MAEGIIIKRLFCVILPLILLLCAFSGCSGKTGVGTASDEILTYKRLDPDKTTLIVSRTGNIDIEGFSEEFEKRNPDVQVVCIDITGGGGDVSPMEDWLENGYAPDIMFWSSNLLSSDYIAEYFTSLSTNPATGNYQAEALNDVAFNGNIYCLPCPSEVQCMIYNKTLFEKYGWELPDTFDEFVALCDQITEDTNGEIEPWNPNAKYSNEFQTVIEGFFYEELFGGAENRTWFDSVIEGEGDFSSHMKPMYDAISTLVDHGILREDHFTYSATARSKEFQAGKIAMINFTATSYDSDEFEFALMPFPSSTGGQGYICKSYNALVGVPIKEQNAKVQDAIDRYIAFFSTEEGQNIFIGDSLEISNVKNVVTRSSSVLEPLQSALNEGRQFNVMNFESAYGRVNVSLTSDARSIASGEKTAEECLEAVDADPYKRYDDKEKAKLEAIAVAEEDFTVLETSFYIADMYRETAGADIGLIANGIAYRGNLMRIFTGDLTAPHVQTLLPRSIGNDSTLVKAVMTGSQLLDALNDPLGADDLTADCVYAFSGLKCEIAPWNPQGQRIISATLADGTAIEDDRQYTVAFWSGTVFDKYITEIVQTYDGTWEELMTAKLSKDGSITPSDDGRVALTWK